MVIRTNVEEGTMNGSRQFFSRNYRQNSTNPLSIRVGDIIRYQFDNDETMWIGVVIQTNHYNYPHMANVQWFNDGLCGTVDLRQCSCVARA